MRIGPAHDCHPTLGETGEIRWLRLWIGDWGVWPFIVRQDWRFWLRECWLQFERGFISGGPTNSLFNRVRVRIGSAHQRHEVRCVVRRLRVGSTI